MTDLGRTLIFVGLVIAAAGAVLTFSGRLPWLGRLPGDIHIKKEEFSFFIPLTSCFILSAVISLLLWLFRR